MHKKIDIKIAGDVLAMFPRREHARKVNRTGDWCDGFQWCGHGDSARYRDRHDEREREVRPGRGRDRDRSEEHTSELQSLMRISYAVFCLKKKKIWNIEKTKAR